MKVYLIAHLLISIIIWFLGINKINPQERFTNFVIALFFPIGGYILAIVLYLTRDIKSKKELKPEEDIVIETLFTDRVAKDSQTQIASLEEILLLNNNKTKRRQVMNLLTDDSSKHLQMLKVAMRDEDVETSHYAAAAIADIKSNLENELQDFLVRYEQNKTDVEIADGYTEVLKEYIESNLLDEVSLKKYQYIYTQVLEEMIINYVDNQKYYVNLISELFKLMEFKIVRGYCEEFMSKYKNENAYFSMLKLHYISKDKENFEIVLEELMNSTIKLSKAGLERIRFWLKVMK